MDMAVSVLCAIAQISSAMFNVSSSTYTFEEAQDYCLSMGMHLASIHSEDENIEAVTLSAAYTPVWIGGYSVDQTNYDFTWTDGSQWNYTNWNTNEPNDWGGNEDCVQLLSSGLWNDKACSTSLNALCRVPGTREIYDYI